MNNSHNHSKTSGYAYFFGVLGTFLIIGWLVSLLVERNPSTELDAKRVQERRKNLAELQQANASVLTTYGVVDPAKQLYRVPVSRAKELVLQEWKNPEAGRSNLMVRLEKATAKPPKAPEKPGQYE